MLDFRPITPSDRMQYETCLAAEPQRGCEYTFSNLYLWGRQKILFRDGLALLFSQFSRRTVYPFPVGAGDKLSAVDLIISDAKERGIPVRITGLLPSDKQLLEEAYPGMFTFHCDRNAHDYVYDINALADLPGKKLHGKRNHLNRFRAAYPDALALPLSECEPKQVQELAQRWYEERSLADPTADFHMERAALERALREHASLGMRGLVLMADGEAIALTLGSPFRNTFDVQFEKARAGIEGAYTAINAAFADYVRNEFPEVQYLNREEDMGIEGLRRAKLSYHPHHMIEKFWAHTSESGYDY